jgi:hypothetical protein
MLKLLVLYIVTWPLFVVLLVLGFSRGSVTFTACMVVVSGAPALATVVVNAIAWSLRERKWAARLLRRAPFVLLGVSLVMWVLTICFMPMAYYFVLFMVPFGVPLLGLSMCVGWAAARMAGHELEAQSTSSGPCA